MKLDEHYLAKELYSLVQKDLTLFDFLQEGSLDGVWYWDLESPEDEWMSPRFWEVLGYDPVTMKHKSSEWQDLIFPEDLQVAIDNFNKHCADSQHPYDQVVRYRHKDGSTVWVRCRGIAIRDSLGKPVRMLGAHTELTKQKQAEQALQKSREELERKVQERTEALNATNNELAKQLNIQESVESDLKEREELFRSTFEQAAVGIAHVAPDGGFIRVNQRLCDLLEYNCQELSNLSFQEITHPDDLQSDSQNVARILAGEIATVSRQKRYLKKDGSILWANLTLSLVRDASGGPKYFIPVIEEITERKKIEEDRDRILDLTQDLICVAGVDGYFRYLNPAWEKTLGYTREEMLSRPYLDFIHPEDHLRNDQEVENLAAGKQTIEFENRYIAKDGAIHTILWKATPLVDEGLMYCCGRDITERKKAIAELLRERDFSESLINTAQTVIMVLNPDGTVRSINNYMEDICGYKLEEVKGKNWFETFLPNQDWEKIRKVFRQAIGDVQTKGNVNPIVTKDGREVFIEWYDKTLKDADGKVVGLLSVGQDVSAKMQAEKEKKKLEVRLQQAQKMEAIGTLAGGIAHDFNNILAAILGYAEIVQEELPPGGDLWAKQKEVLNAANRAKELVKQILAFSRQTVHERKPIEVHLVVKEVLKLLRASIPATIEIRQKIEVEKDSVLADSTQIHQVVMNLCTNAYHAMRESGGVLTVELLQTDLKKEADIVQALHLIPGAYLVLKVSDTGHGMERGLLERIFDPYFTTKKKEEGTGMGLAVVHGIVKSLAGYIAVRSEPGQGTVFRVYLPRLVAATSDIEMKRADEVPGGSERILVVDDDAAIARLQKQMLEGLGYKVSAFVSSDEALGAFCANPLSFDLIITDMTMPHMTGAELSQKALSVRPDIPIVMCTGFSELMDEAKAKALGIREYIMKPIVRSDMAKIIRKVLN